MIKQAHALFGTLFLLCCGLLPCMGEDMASLPDIEIATAEKPAVKEVTFPAIPRKPGGIVVLKARIFYKYPTPSGWNSLSSIRLNGKTLGSKTASGASRLLRRGEFMRLADENRAWFDGNNGILLMTGPGEGEVDKRILDPREEGYWYYLDISDLVLYDEGNAAEVNELAFCNAMTKVYTGGENKPLAVRDASILILSREEHDGARMQDKAVPGSGKKAEACSMVAAFPDKDRITLPDVEVPTADQQSFRSIIFPAIPKVTGMVPVLKARIFYAMPATSGWNNSSSLVLNGMQMGRYTASGCERLLRRGEFMKLADEERSWWDKSNGLLVMFGPGEGEVDKRIMAPREEGYWYYLDISDLVNYVETGFDGRIESEKNNSLRFFNGMTRKLAGDMACPLTARDLEIIYMTPEELAKVQNKPATKTVVPSAVKAVMNPGAARVSITEDGGVILEKNNERYFWSAAFSYPASPKMEFDCLSPDRQAARKGWKMSVKQTPGNGSVTVSASVGDRRITRTLKVNGDFLEVVDSVSNLGKDEIGMMTRYSAISEAELPSNAVYLAGMPEVTMETGCGANPTVFLQGKKSGLGVMALEAAFRCHLKLTKTASNCVEMSHPTALVPGETYSQRYLLMLTDKGDYFAFVNAVRQHLNLNRTIDGPMVLGMKYISQARQGRITTESFNTHWFEYGDMKSLEMSRDEFRELFLDGVAKHRRQYPGIKVLPMMEMSPRYLDKRRIPHASLLPDSKAALTGTYGEVISREATAVLEKETPYGDSILRTADGRAIIDTYYPAEPEMSLLVYPYQNNAHQKKLLEQADFLLTEVGADGIYIDQFAPGSMFSIAHSRDRVTYDRWDGRSVDLNEDGSVRRKMFDIALASAPARIEFIRNVLDKGKIFLANTQPVTTEEADAGGYRFYESDAENLAPMLGSTGKPGAYRLQAFSQLSPCPMILGTRPGIFFQNTDMWAKVYNRAFICALRHGLLYCHYGMSTRVDCYGLVNHMFPLTPVELGEGFIIGKERILTAISRDFVVDVRPVKVIGFDAEGGELPNAADVRQMPDGKWKVSVKINDWNSSCAIVLSGAPTPFDELETER